MTPAMKNLDIVEMENFISVKDFELLAAKKLLKEILRFVSYGSTIRQTLEENTSDFKSWRFQPRVLKDVSHVDTSSSVLGSRVSFPICVAPFGPHKMASSNGEIDSARAAESIGTGFAMSIFSSCTIEEVAKKVPNCLRWFQLYILNDRQVTKSLIQRAEKHGYRAIIITVDMAALSREYKNLNSQLERNHNLPSKNLKDDHFEKGLKDDRNTGLDIDQSITWNDIDWIKTITDLPIIIKGIVSVPMALEAVKHNISGIIISNHGGRCLNGTLSSLQALSQVTKAVMGRCEVYYDGGIRSGEDVVKALALGAKAVFVGRPIIWGLACGGEEGVRKILKILKEECETAMKLLGVTSIADMQSTHDIVLHESKIMAQL